MLERIIIILINQKEIIQHKTIYIERTNDWNAWDHFVHLL